MRSKLPWGGSRREAPLDLHPDYYFTNPSNISINLYYFIQTTSTTLIPQYLQQLSIKYIQVIITNRTLSSLRSD